MKKLAVMLLAVAFAIPAAAAGQDLAPAVKRKPAATASAPAAPVRSTPTAPVPATAAPAEAAAAQSAPQHTPRPGSERDYVAALSAAVAQGGGDPALDTSLIRVMGRLMSAGRCSEAAGLAARDGRKQLASTAVQICR